MQSNYDFLLENEHFPIDSDDFLHKGVTNSFLIGQGSSVTELDTNCVIQSIVRKNFRNMDAYYKEIWRPKQPLIARFKLPRGLTIVSHTRSFMRQSSIASGALALQPLYSAASTDGEITQAILNVIQTISLPGFSRHHWGTEIDVVSTRPVDWVGFRKYVPLIPFLKSEASRFGFFQPYSGQRPSNTLPHYQAEPWHLSFWGIANLMQQQWTLRITGQTLSNLITQTAQYVHGSINVIRMERILGAIGLQHFQSNVAKSP